MMKFCGQDPCRQRKQEEFALCELVYKISPISPWVRSCRGKDREPTPLGEVKESADGRQTAILSANVPHLRQEGSRC